MSHTNIPPWDTAEAAAARSNWERHTCDVVFQNPWISVESSRVTAPTGNPAQYGVVRFMNRAIAVFALHDDGTVPLVGQQRFAVDAYSWEIPEGGGPHGIEPLESIQRELLEETGLKASRWTELQRIHLSNSVSDELGIIYLARGLQQFEAQPEETEQLTVRKLPFEEVYQMVINSQITDSLTVAAVLRVKLLILENRLP